MTKESNKISPDRELWNGPWYIEWSARILAAGIIQFFTMLLRLVAARRINSVSVHRPKTILLTAGSASPNWLKNHLLPLASSDACRELYMVTDDEMPPLPKITWIVPSQRLKKIAGRTPARLITYLRTANRIRPDICGGFHLFLNGLTALLAARRIGAMSMYFCVGGMTEILGGAAYNEHFPLGRTGRMNRTLEKCLVDLVRYFDLIITMGSGAKRFLESQGIHRPIAVVPGGIDEHNFCPNGDTKLYDLVVTCRLVPVKRLDVFLNVVRDVSRFRPGVRAVIVGDGEQRKWLKDMSTSLGLGDKIVFAGTQSSVISYLRQSRLFLLTSDSEGLALSLMEAMMCGLPVVASNVGDLGDLVKNGVNGWLVPRRNVAAFSEKVLSLLTDSNRYSSFSRQARAQAVHVGLSAIANRWERILRT